MQFNTCGSTSERLASLQVKASVEECQLTDVPTAQIKAILHHLSSRDHGSLRLVSRAVNRHITQHVPYLTFRLSSSSSMQHVRQWCQATHQLQHVSSIHILIAGEVMADVFNLAMQLLSYRNSITELHLLAAKLASNAGSSVNWLDAQLPTLLPIRYVIDRLKTLVISGIAVKNLAGDLQQAATAAAEVAGCQLQCLNIRAFWTYPMDVREVDWPEFQSALRYLNTAFPMLRQLQFELPQLGCVPARHIKTLRDGAWPCECQLTIVAAAAAVGNAAVAFQHLEQLTVSSTYNIWQPIGLGVGESAVGIAAEARKGMKEAIAVLDSSLSSGLLPSMSATTAAFGTLDDFAHWLLQHHATLTTLRVGIRRSAWQFEWQQPRGPAHTTAPAPVGIVKNISASSMATDDDLLRRMYWSRFLNCWVPSFWERFQFIEQLDRIQGIASSSSSSADGDGSSTCNNTQSPMHRFLRSLSPLSSRSAAELMRYITSYQLELFDDDRAECLVALLNDLLSVEDLEIMLYCDPFNDEYATSSEAVQPCSPAAAVTAIAAIQNLKSLTMRMHGLKSHLPNHLLLPLTTVAGGPGSGLRRLHLEGRFLGAAAASTVTVHAPAQWTCPVLGYFHVLRQLDGLVHLGISHSSFQHPCLISVSDLPASLESFMGKNLIIYSPSAASSSAAAVAPPAGGRDRPYDTVTGGICANLQSLHTIWCHLTSPDILASIQLQELSLIGSTWSGGWEAAVAAWPNVMKLLWRPDDSKINRELTSDAHALEDICAGFSHLGTLSLEVPELWLSVEVLQPVVQYLNTIRYITFHAVQKYMSMGLDPITLQQWLQLQLPWANVVVKENGHTEESSCLSHEC